MAFYDVYGVKIGSDASASAVPSSDNFIRTINHQGYRLNGAIANTIPAFKDSYAQGYRYIETDIRFTSDNVPVLSHDATWGGLTVSDNTLEQMRAVTQGSGAYSTTIATLDELMHFCKLHNIHPYLELKEGAADQVAAAHDVVAKYGMLKNVTWISAYQDYVANVVAIDPSARIGKQGSSGSTGSDASLSALKTDTNEVVVYINYGQISEANCTSLVKAGYKVGAYTISSEALFPYFDTLSEIGVTEFTADFGHAEDYVLSSYDEGVIDA